METPRPTFLDASRLLEQSQPRPSVLRLWHSLVVLLILGAISSWFSDQPDPGSRLIGALAGFAALCVLVGVLVSILLAIRRARDEQRQLESIEELMRLRRWSEAGLLIEQLLSRAPRTLNARVGGLIFLSNVLMRYERFDEAISVQNVLLEHAPLDPPTAHGVKLSRAMAMLRTDRLFDADGALSILRREVGREDEKTAVMISGPLALLEIYRDVKTGHSPEALKLFDDALPAMRRQLGHRLGDAYVLASLACARLRQDEEAQRLFTAATLLVPAGELHRRYPETAELSTRFVAASSPLREKAA